MSVFLRVAAVAALVCIVTTLAAGDGKKPKEIKGWGTVTDPDGDCTFKENKGKLTVIVPGGFHDLHPDRAMNAPRILREIEGDFTATVKVTCALTPGQATRKGRTAGYLAGLLLWIGDKEYIRLERNALRFLVGGEPKSYVPLLEYWKDGTTKVVVADAGGTDSFKADSTWFQFQRKGGNITARYSHDGKKWVVTKGIDTDLPKKLHIGVAALNTSDTPFTVEFGELKVEASK